MHKQAYARALTLLAGLAFLATTVNAGTAAYWRHEEGPLGAVVANGPGAIVDSSGNGNTQRTFDNTFTGATYTDAVSPKPLRSGLPNTLALDFTPNHDNFSDDNTPIKSQLFTGITVEAAFNLQAIGGYYNIVGKDGRPTAGPLAPLQLKVRGDTFPNDIAHQIQLEFLDGDGDVFSLASGFSAQTDTWYHVAAVIQPTGAELWIATGLGDYVLVDSVAEDMAGAQGEVVADAPNENWTVGRGMFDGNIADWADATIDEVRISDMPLSSDEFLFVPEPTPLLLFALAAGCLLNRRR